MHKDFDDCLAVGIEEEVVWVTPILFRIPFTKTHGADSPESVARKCLS